MKYYAEPNQHASHIQQSMEPSAIDASTSKESLKTSYQKKEWNLHHHSWKQQCQRRQINKVDYIKKKLEHSNYISPRSS